MVKDCCLVGTSGEGAIASSEPTAVLNPSRMTITKGSIARSRTYRLRQYHPNVSSGKYSLSSVMSFLFASMIRSEFLPSAAFCFPDSCFSIGTTSTLTLSIDFVGSPSGDFALQALLSGSIGSSSLVLRSGGLTFGHRFLGTPISWGEGEDIPSIASFLLILFRFPCCPCFLLLRAVPS
jgi:hypothetical protein